MKKKRGVKFKYIIYIKINLITNIYKLYIVAEFINITLFNVFNDAFVLPSLRE